MPANTNGAGRFWHPTVTLPGARFRFTSSNRCQRGGTVARYLRLSFGTAASLHARVEFAGIGWRGVPDDCPASRGAADLSATTDFLQRSGTRAGTAMLREHQFHGARGNCRIAEIGRAFV